VTAEMALDWPNDTAKKNRRRTRPQLLSRAELDRRCNAVQQFDHLANQITADLGHDLTAVERKLVEAFVGAAIVLDSLNARVLLGEQVSLAEHAQTVSAMVRVASRLGLQRRAKDITPPDPLHYRANEDAAA
jgi:hypothetical protein